MSAEVAVVAVASDKRGRFAIATILCSNMAETEESKKELKRRFQLWIRPSVLDLAQQFHKMDNCESRSEFIEKAIIFYAGYVSSNKRLYFKLCVNTEERHKIKIGCRCVRRSAAYTP